MLFEIPETSRAFMALAAKRLRGLLSPDEQSQFDQLLKQHPVFKAQFAELAAEIGESKLDEIWERGLRVLLRCPHSEDKPFLESVKKSDPKAWNDFLKGAFVLRVMAESMKNPATPTFSDTLTPDEETDLLAAVNAAQELRKRRGGPPAGN